MKYRDQLITDLREKIIYPEVYNNLSPSIISHIVDYLLLKEHVKINMGNNHQDNFCDWSFSITPIFKALEGVLLHISKGLGLEPEKYNYKIGVIFNEENLEKLYIDVIDKLEGIEDLKKTDIKQWLDGARRIMRHFRHNPAHFLGEKQVTKDRAIMTGDNALETINQLYKSLLEADLITYENKAKFTEEFKR